MAKKTTRENPLVEHYCSDGYAGIKVGRFHYHYGYEKEDLVTEEWMFQVKKDGKEIYTLKTSDIQDQSKRDQLKMLKLSSYENLRKKGCNGEKLGIKT